MCGTRGGGTPFFNRKEVRDMIAYLWVLLNPADEVRLRRIVNEPSRGIGDRTLETAAQLAAAVLLLGYVLFKKK